MSTKRIRLVVAYDGTDFCGWAAQPGHRTVQGTLTEAVRSVSGEETEIWGASRTDSGAHAQGQVCHFDTALPMDPAKWVRVLNRRLPRDLQVQRSVRVSPAFHSRFCAEDRTYRYRIAERQPGDPFLSRFRFDYGRQLDLEAMREAAVALVGEHDFRAFTEELAPHVENTRRTLHEVRLSRVGGEIRLQIRGTAFLRGMMRRIAGGLFEVGRGHRPPEDLARLLDLAERDLLAWPVVLPACGLCLMRVRYGRPPRDSRTVLSS